MKNKATGQKKSTSRPTGKKGTAVAEDGFGLGARSQGCLQRQRSLSFLSAYHSKYNPIERCWGMLEMHCNGALLDTIETARKWAQSMTWKATHPVVKLLDQIYETGVRLTQTALKRFAERLQRSEILPKWSVQIFPRSVLCGNR